MRFARISLAALIVALMAISVIVGLDSEGQPATASGTNVKTTPDSDIEARHFSLVLDSAGYPVVSYGGSGLGFTNGLRILHCFDVNCEGRNSIAVPESGGLAFYYPSIQLDASGFPVVSYIREGSGYHAPGDLKVLHCGDATCTSGNTITTPDNGDIEAEEAGTSLALDASGNPVVAYARKGASSGLYILHCGDSTCSSGNSIVNAGPYGEDVSLELDASGYPVVSYGDPAAQNLKILHCGDANCTSGNSITTPDSAGFDRFETSLTLDASGFPVVSYNDWSMEDLKVLHCGDANCSAGNTIASPETVNGGVFTSLSLDASGFPIVAYVDSVNGHLKMLQCGDAACSSGNKISRPAVDALGFNVSAFPYGMSAALDAGGNTVAVYRSSKGVKVLHCGSTPCPSTKETYNVVSSLDPEVLRSSTLTGDKTALALDSSGIPALSYNVDDYGAGELRIARCGNAACSSGNTTTTVGTDGDWSSIVPDANGFPVVSYTDAGVLSILHCGDTSCTSGNSIATPYVAPYPSAYTALALDASGFPVVAFAYYFDNLDWDLKILHCGDANCASGNTIETFEDFPLYDSSSGLWVSMVLDSNGFPVMTYYDASAQLLSIRHCQNASCSSSHFEYPDLAGGDVVGEFTSLVLDSNGYPVVSYYDQTNEMLKVLHCGDGDCSSGNIITSVASAPQVDTYTSLVLDSNGYPVITYETHDSSFHYNFLHCGDANCSAGNTITELAGVEFWGARNLALSGSGLPIVAGNDPSVLFCATATCVETVKPTPTPTDTSTPTSTPTATATPYPIPAKAQVSAGHNHTCSLTATGGVKCWGYNGAGQLGDGTTTSRMEPEFVSGLTSGVGHVATGLAHSCALMTADGSVRCWGYNTYGQLGDGTNTQRLVPVVTLLPEAAASVEAGTNYTCAVGVSGAIYCWGYNFYGQLGDGTGTSRNSPVPVCSDAACLTDLTGIAGVSTGDKHTCGLTTGGNVKCWGDNFWLELGDGTSTSSATPVDVCDTGETAPCTNYLSNISAVSVGGLHSCALTTGGGVKCWGNDSSGQLGDPGVGSHTSIPVDMTNMTSGVTQVSAGGYFTCVLKSAHVWCAGSNSYGQVGDGTSFTRPTAVIVCDILTTAPCSEAEGNVLDGAVYVNGGWEHACTVVSPTGQVRCWGYNGSGQLGGVSSDMCSGEACNRIPLHVLGPGPTPSPTITATFTDTPTATDSPTPTETPIPHVYVMPASQSTSAATAGALIMADDVTDLGAYSFEISWDDAVLSFVSVTNGPLLGSTGRTVDCPAPVTTAASVAFSCTTTGAQAGPNGSGILASITFGTVADGTSPVAFASMTIEDTSSGDLGGTTTDGSITYTTPTETPVVTPTPTKQPKPADTDGDGCPDEHENTTGRDYLDPWDYYDVAGASQARVHDGVIDLTNDILSVIQHYAPTGDPPYDAWYDRGPSDGWPTAPDGVIDLTNDILGVILQYSPQGCA